MPGNQGKVISGCGLAEGHRVEPVVNPVSDTNFDSPERGADQALKPGLGRTDGERLLLGVARRMRHGHKGRLWQGGSALSTAGPTDRRSRALRLRGGWLRCWH